MPTASGAAANGIKTNAKLAARSRNERNVSGSVAGQKSVVAATPTLHAAADAQTTGELINPFRRAAANSNGAEPKIVATTNNTHPRWIKNRSSCERKLEITVPPMNAADNPERAITMALRRPARPSEANVPVTAQGPSNVIGYSNQFISPKLVR